MTESPAQPWHDVLDFWFPEGRNVDVDAETHRKHWFWRMQGGADESIVVRFPELTARGAQGADGKWFFRLADGSEWRQIDSDPVRFQNRAGTEIRVRRASLGSYQLTAGRSRAVRVKRQ